MITVGFPPVLRSTFPKVRGWNVSARFISAFLVIAIAAAVVGLVFHIDTPSKANIDPNHVVEHEEK